MFFKKRAALFQSHSAPVHIIISEGKSGDPANESKPTPVVGSWPGSTYLSSLPVKPSGSAGNSPKTSARSGDDTSSTGLSLESLLPHKPKTVIIQIPELGEPKQNTPGDSFMEKVAGRLVKVSLDTEIVMLGLEFYKLGGSQIEVPEDWEIQKNTEELRALAKEVLTLNKDKLPSKTQ